MTGADSGQPLAGQTASTTSPSGLSGRIKTATDEPARIAALRDLRVLDTAPDPRFDRIVRLAAQLFHAPRAAVILIDEHRLWMKARLGFDAGEWPRRATLVETVLRDGRALFSSDVRADPRFTAVMADSAADARFYAAAPLITARGQIIGALSVGDTAPHPTPTLAEQIALGDLAALAMEELIRDADAAIAREHSAVDQERVDLALGAAGLAGYEWDLETDRLLLSERLAALIGFEGDSLPANRGAVLAAVVHPDDRELAGATGARRGDPDQLRTLSEHGILPRMVRSSIRRPRPCGSQVPGWWCDARMVRPSG